MPEVKYNRRTHVIGLILAAIVYIALLVFAILHSGAFVYAGWLIGLVIFAAFWWMRSLGSLVKWFPLFHYITLIIEFVSHCLSLLYSTYWAIMFVLAIFKGFNMWVLLVAICLVLLVPVYLLLVYVLVAVPYVLLKGSLEQKAALSKEVISSDAVSLPGGVAIPTQQQA